MRKYGRIQGETKKKEVMSVGTFGRYKAGVEERTENRRRLALRNKVGSENT